jgi:hypothetical protein
MAKQKTAFKAEHLLMMFIGLFAVAYLSSFFKTAGNDLGRNEANRLFN